MSPNCSSNLLWALLVIGCYTVLAQHAPPPLRNQYHHIVNLQEPKDDAHHRQPTKTSTSTYGNNYHRQRPAHRRLIRPYDTAQRPPSVVHMRGAHQAPDGSRFRYSAPPAPYSPPISAPRSPLHLQPVPSQLLKPLSLPSELIHHQHQQRPWPRVQSPYAHAFLVRRAGENDDDNDTKDDAVSYSNHRPRFGDHVNPWRWPPLLTNATGTTSSSPVTTSSSTKTPNATTTTTTTTTTTRKPHRLRANSVTLRPPTTTTTTPTLVTTTPTLPQLSERQSLPAVRLVHIETSDRTDAGEHEKIVVRGAGHKPVTIVRARQKPKLAATVIHRAPPTLAPIFALQRPPDVSEVPAKLQIDDELLQPLGGGHVRLIAKKHEKVDEFVVSPTLTVVDNDTFRLPSNTTTVHNNKLLVPAKHYRPQPPRTQTTQFPLFTLLSGITQWPLPNSNNTQPLGQPNNKTYGLISTNTTHHHQQPLTSTFGAAHIRFPAAPPPLFGLVPEKINISVVDTGENQAASNQRPIHLNHIHNHHHPQINITDAAMDRLKNGTHGDHTNITITFPGANAAPYEKPTSTSTQKPRTQRPTKRINIVSANTTVITTNPDQLHDVLSNAIASSHVASTGTVNGHHNNNQSFHNQNRPSSILSSLTNFLNAGISTSWLAILTLVKTVFVAVLVMFLPPIALTAAIIQAVAVG